MFNSVRFGGKLHRGARGLCTLQYASSCYFPTTWKSVPLLARTELNHDSTLYDFGLPEGESLNLPT